MTREELIDWVFEHCYDYTMAGKYICINTSSLNDRKLVLCCTERKSNPTDQQLLFVAELMVLQDVKEDRVQICGPVRNFDHCLRSPSRHPILEHTHMNQCLYPRSHWSFQTEWLVGRYFTPNNDMAVYYADNTWWRYICIDWVRMDHFDDEKAPNRVSLDQLEYGRIHMIQRMNDRATLIDRWDQLAFAHHYLAYVQTLLNKYTSNGVCTIVHQYLDDISSYERNYACLSTEFVRRIYPSIDPCPIRPDYEDRTQANPPIESLTVSTNRQAIGPTSESPNPPLASLRMPSLLQPPLCCQVHNRVPDRVIQNPPDESRATHRMITWMIT